MTSECDYKLVASVIKTMLQNVPTVTGARTASTNVDVSVAARVTKLSVVRHVINVGGLDRTVTKTSTNAQTPHIIVATTRNVSTLTARSAAPVNLLISANSTPVSVRLHATVNVFTL